MHYLVEILLSLIMSLFVFTQLIRVNFFAKKANGCFTGLVNMTLLTFGVFLWIKNGLIIDYGTRSEVTEYKAYLMFFFGIACIVTSLIFIAISISKFIYQKL